MSSSVFGVKPFKNNSESATPSLTRAQRLQRLRVDENLRLRRQRYIARIWPLGERPMFELVEHLVRVFDLDVAEVDRILAKFAGLNADTLRALGADRLPPPPIHMVARR
jgi:hypothetical protein